MKRLLLSLILLSLTSTVRAEAPDYAKDVAPLLVKYCAGCHNADDPQAELALDSHAAAMKGSGEGLVIAPGKSGESKLIRVLTGKDEPAMPPEGEARPSDEEIALLAAWIDAGAPGSAAMPALPETPKIPLSAPARRPINAAAWSPDGAVIALARYGAVELLAADGGKITATLEPVTGNVNAVCFSPNGSLLAAAAGEAGLFGEVSVWSLADDEPKLLHTLRGHRDSIYALDISPDGKLLATGSYDHDVTLWALETGEELRTLENHNGAVFGVAFHPRGHLLASASADRTVKLWEVESGKRLDTFEQSTQETYALAFHPDGKRLAAAGADNRIRVWSISESGAEGTNPLLVSRFGHEKAILRLTFSRDGRTLVSTGEDRLVKIWDGGSILLRETLPPQPDWSSGVAIAPGGASVFAGRLDGTWETYAVADAGPLTEEIAPMASETVSDHAAAADSPPMAQAEEAEPNNTAETAMPLTLPAVVKGRLHVEGDPLAADADLYRIEAKAGESWVVETNAARSGSPADTKIEVLDEQGRPVPRVLLRATRDSWITFRGIDSSTIDCRVVNWEEMELNQLLYMNGEVVKLYRAPQGPDSGFQFYPGAGKRHTFFDTTAQAHALDEPCYIVTPYPPGTELPNNGLPTFTVYYENDDEHRQAYGKDSFLTFTAPEDGVYLVRVTDVRGFAGESFSYELTVRRPRPDFKVTLGGANPAVSPASGKRFTVKAERIDGFDGEIRVDIQGLPPGFRATTPLVIEAGHLEARGVINALPDAIAPTEENAAKIKVTATATIGGKDVTHEVNSLGTAKLAEEPKLFARLSPLDAKDPAQDVTVSPDDEPAEIVIRPGATVTCRLSIDRNGFDDRVQFDVDNLPHGVIVDNIGLNGVLIPEGKSERTLYLTAADWVPETRRQFFAVAKAAGEQASFPLWLRVERPAD
jgi:WD40 repeat protein